MAKTKIEIGRYISLIKMDIKEYLSQQAEKTRRTPLEDIPRGWSEAALKKAYPQGVTHRDAERMMDNMHFDFSEQLESDASQAFLMLGSRYFWKAKIRLAAANFEGTFPRIYSLLNKIGIPRPY